MWRHSSTLVLMLACVVASLIHCGLAKSKSKVCRFDMIETNENERAMLFNTKTMQLEYPVMKDGKKKFVIKDNPDLIVSCPGSKFIGSKLKDESYERKCGSGGRFSIGGEKFDINDISCAKDIKEDVVKHTPRNCGHDNKSVLHYIGFWINKENFVDFIEVCFNHLQEATIYTKHIIHGKSLSAAEKGSRVAFKTGEGFFTGSANNYYKKITQEQQMKRLLNKDVINDTAQLYLVKGHLSPDADCIYHDEAQATYYLINVYGQWQSINNGNWKKIEGNVRKFAEYIGDDLTVWTGGYGVLKLKHNNGSSIDIFLGLFDKKTPQRIMPVPRITWKVVYHNETKRGVAFAVINNPFNEHNVHDDEHICNDVCKDIDQLGSIEDPSDKEKGKTFCCKVDDLRKMIPDVPDLGNIGLLGEEISRKK